MNTTDLEAEQEERPKLPAFEEAKAGHELFDEELKPFSPSRKVAAQTMGMLYPLIGDSGAEQLEKMGTYPGMIKDIAIVLWLCTLEDSVDRRSSDWTPSKALRKPDEALEVAIDWAAEKSIIDLSSEPAQKAMMVFMSVVTADLETQFQIKVEGQGQSPAQEDEDTKV
jgi:hypothetical protein